MAKCLRLLVWICCLLVSVGATAQTPVISSTLSVSLTGDNNTNGQANPGDQLSYSLVITNTGSGSATGVNLTMPAPPNTTLVGGSLKTSALARPDAYTVSISGPLNGSSVLTNDFGLPTKTVLSFGPSNAPASMVANGTNTAPSDQGGTVVMNTDGTFSYTPTGSFVGYDKFGYTATTTTPPNDAATVTIGVGTPVTAVANSYSITGNVTNTQPAPGLLGNDVGDQRVVSSVNGLTANVGVAVTTAQSGTVTVAANGSFIYEPLAGYTGPDSFTYSANNGYNAPSTAVVSLTIVDMIWFVNAGAASNGTGTLAKPFNNLASFAALNNGSGNNPAAGDNIFLYVGTYTGGLTLLANQKLIGAGATASLATIASITPAPGSAALPATGGADPVITNGSGNGVSLSTGNLLRGLTIGNSLANALAGSSFGTLTVADLTINTGGQGLALTNGAVAGSFDSVSSTAGVSNVALTSVTGSFSINGGALSGASGSSFSINGGSVSVVYSGNLSQANNAAMVTVVGGHSGTLTFQTGTLNATNGTGLQFDNADGTYTFNGTVTLAGGDAGIDIVNGSTGTFTFGTGTTITNPSGTGFNLNGSNANLTYSGSISDNSGYAVNIDNHDSGTITFQTGTITSTGSGLRVLNSGGGTINFNNPTKTLTTTTNPGVDLGSSNAGGTVNFGSGGLVITTTSGTGFLATGGGTVNVTGTGNSILSGAATALNVANTTIGASGLTFQSISANGGSVVGINLNTTGNSGGLTVTGTGTTSGSGGTIQNKTADGIALNSVGALVYLKNMIIQDINGSTDASDVVDTKSGNDGIHAASLSGGLKIESCIIRRISDDGVNGSTFGSLNPPTATSFVGLEVLNSTIELCNRFNISERGDATDEAGIRVAGLSGTVSLKNNTIQNCGSGIQIYTASSGTIDVTIQGNSLLNINKEFTTNPSKRVGLYGIDYRVFGSISSVVRIGDPLEVNASLGNTFLNCAVASIRLVDDVGTVTGNTKSILSKNTFTVTDHTSPQSAPGSQVFNFPQGGVLLRPRGTGNFESVFSNNTFTQCMHADGGLGNLSLIIEGGNTEFKVTGNTFGLPWDAPVELRADGQSGTQASASVLFQNNIYTDGTVGSSSDDLGQAYPSPYEPFYTQVRNNGRLGLTMQNETMALEDPSQFAQSLHCQTTTSGDILNLFLSNIQSPRGFRLKQNAGTTYNLYRGVSASNVPQTILQDNNCRGGGGVDSTNPPSVTVDGTITPTNTAPTLPNISGF